MPSDPAKARARKRAYRRRKKVEKYGEHLADVDMRGRHGNHSHGPDHYRAASTIVSSHGYVISKVDPGHPHAWKANGRQWYAYEHHVVIVKKLGRPLSDSEVVHHINGDKTDNRPENIEVMSRDVHGREHAYAKNARGPDGRFLPSGPRVTGAK